MSSARTRRALLLATLALTLGSATAEANTATCRWDAGAGAGTGSGCAAADRGPLLRVSPDGDDSTGTGSVAAPFRTLKRALNAAGSGPATIEIDADVQPLLVDSLARKDEVVVRGAGSARPTIQGAKLYGARKLRFEQVTFSERVLVNHHGSLAEEQRAADITFANVEFTLGCLQARNFDRLELLGSWLHVCGVGVSLPEAPQESSSIRISGNLIERLTSDGIMAAAVRGLEITDNVITNIHRTADSGVHNDGLQLYGRVTDTVLERNVISDSEHQLIFIGDDVGPNDGLLMRNNLLHGSGAYAVQSHGTTRARFIANTIWDSRWSALLLRASKKKTASGEFVVPKDTVVANNILAGLVLHEGAKAALSGNVESNCDHKMPGVKCVKNLKPFVDEGVGDYRLPEDTFLRGEADPAHAPAEDLTGRSRTIPATPGALEPIGTTTADPGPAPGATPAPTATATATATPKPSVKPPTTPAPGTGQAPAAIVPQLSVQAPRRVVMKKGRNRLAIRVATNVPGIVAIRLRRGNRVVSKAATVLASATTTPFDLAVPGRTARRPHRLEVYFQSTAGVTTQHAQTVRFVSRRR